MTATVSFGKADWKAPRTDGDLLLWPAPADLLAQTRSNLTRLNHSDIRIQNTPLHELRTLQRQWIGHDPSIPLIATGHQTELHHPGVWVKNALINAAAQAIGGQAYHFAVDTDEPKHLHLKWPGAFESITDDPALTDARWSGLLAPPTPGHIAGIESVLQADSASWSFKPVAPTLLEALRRNAVETENLPHALVNAEHELDWSLGLRHHVMLTSPIWMAEPFMALAHHLLATADQFAAHYNTALDEYRAAAGITTPGRPMPDLRITPNEIECPYWVDSIVHGTRQRAAVVRIGSAWALRVGTDAFTFDPSIDAMEAARLLLRFLRVHGLRLSPRALTLTLFMRLLVADNFVHGIGGGRYDQVLDRLITLHFGIDPPAYSVTTATLFFPGAAGRTRTCLPCLRQEGHHLRHSLLGEEKQLLVAEIDALPRYSSARRSLFDQIHRKLRQSITTDPRIDQWEASYADAQARAAEDTVLFDRELFYALQPKDRLMGLIDKCNAFFALA